MTMAIDPKTNRITYRDLARAKAFGEALAKAMVDNLNKKVLAEKQLIEKFSTNQLKAIE